MMRYIFGHSPSTDPDEFPTKDHALEYLRSELPYKRSFRYRTTYNLRSVDSIIFSFAGDLLAELVVAAATAPSDKDRNDYSKTRKVYQISDIRIFRDRTVRASDVGLTHLQFGAEVSDDVYSQIIARAGGFEQDILPAPKGPEQDDLPQIPADRVIVTSSRIVRDTPLAHHVKHLHGYQCQLCGWTIQGRYIEVHHVQPLGRPHNGPDVIGNLLCVCPNHHAQLDLGVIAVSSSALRRVEGHVIDPKYIEYHNSHIYKIGTKSERSGSSESSP